jgi:hypothetical protein
MLPVSISFPGMRQPYFYSQTVSVEFSTLRANLFRLQSSFTLYLCSSFIFPFFPYPVRFVSHSPLFSIFLNKPYLIILAISLFFPIFFYFPLLCFIFPPLYLSLLLALSLLRFAFISIVLLPENLRAHLQLSV